MLSFFSMRAKKNILNETINEDMINLLCKTFTIPKDYKYSLYTLEDKYVARPDLLAYDIYGDTSYADIICKLNGISNPFEMNENMVLVLPDFIELPFFYTNPKNSEDTLVSEEMNKNKDNNQYKQKTKAELHSSNDLLKGDSNFRIDKKNRIIIY